MKSSIAKWVAPAALFFAFVLTVPTHAEDHRSELETRLSRQEKRIERGIDTGRLRPVETMRLRPREYHAFGQGRQLRPTPYQHIRVERAENHAGRAIRR